ncbi:MAG: hypothetical protein U1E26_06720 [Coriobacteriia bacterium]|nr:hypothetical protein [Coriobacteriia bacterium]
MKVVGGLAVIAAGALLATGCAGPPAALPASVLAQGVEAVPEKHPKMSEEQLMACGNCHRTSDAPVK